MKREKDRLDVLLEEMKTYEKDFDQLESKGLHIMQTNRSLVQRKRQLHMMSMEIDSSITNRKRRRILK